MILTLQFGLLCPKIAGHTCKIGAVNPDEMALCLS